MCQVQFWALGTEMISLNFTSVPYLHSQIHGYFSHVYSHSKVGQERKQPESGVVI